MMLFIAIEESLAFNPRQNLIEKRLILAINIKPISAQISKHLTFELLGKASLRKMLFFSGLASSLKFFIFLSGAAFTPPPLSLS